MAKKRKDLQSKLGSWTDQASLTRTQAQETSPATNEVAEPPAQENYDVNRSLMDRLRDMAHREGMAQNELVGYLLTWSLDQVESGAHTIAKEK